MLLTCSKSPYNCSKCSYVTNRKFNYERHINMVHDIPLRVSEEDLTKVDTYLSKVDTDLSKVDTYLPKVDTTVLKLDNPIIQPHKCNTCYKYFSTKYSLKKHISRCNHKEHLNQCIECKNILSSLSALNHHKKYCKGLPLIVSNNKPNINVPESTTYTNNMIVQQTINIINNNTVNINILPCPLTREESFDFNCENITHTVLKHILQNTNDSSIRFNRFIGKVLENPQNQVIRKTNPKDNHSLIHLGNGKWELAYDKDTLPILTHHMTTAALGKIIEIEKQASFLIESIKGFRNQVTIINQMDYNEDEYKNTIQRIKLKIVNITQELLREEKLLKNEI